MFPENRVARGGVWEYHAISIPLRMHFAKNRNGEPGYSHWVK
jgi:hypothetical protein